jgi:hypothetical protein
MPSSLMRGLSSSSWNNGCFEWHCITGNSIGGGIFVLVLFLRLHTNIISDRTVMYDIVQDNVHEIVIQISISYTIWKFQRSILSYDVTLDIEE